MSDVQDECLCVTDPAAIEHILVTRCYEYEKPAEVRGRLGRTLGKGLVFSQGEFLAGYPEIKLTSVEIQSTGDDHKKQRRLMNPSWTPSSIRELVPSFFEAAHALCDTLSDLLSSEDQAFNSRFGKESDGSDSEGPVIVDVTKVLGAAALQIIGQSELD